VELVPREVELIVAFLGALTGELPGSYLARPPLPGESGPQRVVAEEVGRAGVR
jgi:hypothetical protein